MGQPVTKVVNPHTGTVITVSADEDGDAISSIQEYESAAEEMHAPRSVCAEEGPASLGAVDLPDESDSRALNRKLTEICAEMRSASEPAINSVPDENICELQDRRALCAEMAATTTTTTSIDYEKEEAFCEVPTSLSLCAQPGEIPSSPMTQAKETALWCSKGRSIDSRTEDYRSEAHERNLAKAKYVVSYDDDSVTLMENKTMRSDRSIEIWQSNLDERVKRPVARRAIVDSERISSSGTIQKRPIEQRMTRAEKYVVKKDDDSVIKDARRMDSMMNFGMRKEENDADKKKMESARNTKVARNKYEMIRKNNEWKSQSSPQEFTDKDRVMLKNREIKCTRELSSIDLSEPMESIDDVIVKRENPVKPMLDVENVRLLSDHDNEYDNDNELSSLDPPPPDDFSSIEYHMVEPCNLGKDAALISTQSDDDIEHIHESEVMQMRMKADADNGKCKDADMTINTIAQFSSPVMRRKSSKSTISDDDLEYIHNVDLGFESTNSGDAGTTTALTKASNNNSRRRHSRHTLSSDDDLEHVQLSEVHELELDARLSQREPLQATQEITPMEQQGTKSKSGKKRKDIMVIEKNKAEVPEVTVIYNPLEEVWSRSEESDKRSSTDYFKDKPEGSYPSPTRRLKNRGSKITNFSSSLLPAKRASQITDSDIVEIIDIDAMQKTSDTTPECKILPVIAGARTRKSRKSKRSQSDGQSQENSSTELSFSVLLPSFCSSNVKMTELQEAVQEAVREEPFVELCSKDQDSKALPLAEISWSSIVKKSISPSSDSQEIRKETDLEPLIEVEEKLEADEHARKLEEAKFCGRDSPTFLEPMERVMCGHQSTRQRAYKEEEEEEKEFLFDQDDIDLMTTITVKESILVDFHAPINEEPRVDKDIAHIARTKICRDKENNKATEGSPLFASEVRSVVNETRRGNVATERRELQRESSLQLQPMQRPQVGIGDNDSTTGTSERYDTAFSKMSLESDHGYAEKRNEADREAPSEHSIAAKKASYRSKRKKRR